MKRLMLALALLFAAGILAWSTLSAGVFLVLCALPVLCVIWCLAKKKYVAAACCLLAPVLGYLSIGHSISKIENAASPFYDVQAVIRGRVVNLYETHSYRYADISCESIKSDGYTCTDKQKVRIYFYDENGEGLRYGDVIRLSVPLQKPPRAKGNDEFDRGISLLAQGIGLRGVCEEYSRIGSDIKLTRPLDLANACKEYMNRSADESFTANSSGVLSAFLTGDKSGMSDTLYGAFKTSGLAHIIAVSGTHVNMLLAMVMSVFSVMKIKRRWFSILIYIIVIWLFALVCGMTASVLRATICITLFFAAWFLKRDSDGLNTLGLAALIMLGVNPASFFDVGFQLSIASTAGILIFSKPIAEKLKALPAYIASLVAVCLAAQILTLPLMAHYFGWVSAVSLLSNLLICPVAPVLMYLGMLSSFLGGVPQLGSFIVYITEAFTQAVTYTVLVLASVPNAVLTVGRFSLWGWAAYAAAAAGLFFALTKKKNRALYLLMCAMLIISGMAAANVFSSQASLAFIDVGHGSCALWRLPGATIMVDSGGSDFSDVAARTVVPYLRKGGISKIDAAFLTHYHEDHVLVYKTLLEEGMIKNLILPSGVADTYLKKELEEAAAKSGTAIGYIYDKQTADIDGLSISAYNVYDGREENNGMVYFMQYGATRVCFAGDMVHSGERLLMMKASDLSCNILAVGHHGSKTSTSEAFIEALLPSGAIISCGREPDSEVLDILADYSVPAYTTLDMGTITFIMDERAIKNIEF